MYFRNEFYFLSNMYPCDITFKLNYQMLTFKCSEAAFQACKCPTEAGKFTSIDGFEAKRLGKKVPLRLDWETVKVPVMSKIVKAKFKQNPPLLEKLLNIPYDIVEENSWGDTFWGVCKGEGENNLGRILMDIRDSYNKFYCLVVGSRDFDDYEIMCTILDKILAGKVNVCIVSGGARGADSLAEIYAKKHGYEFKEFKADWDLYGKSAGYKRNEEMHKYISNPRNRDRCVVAFWDGQSRGTQHNFELCSMYDNPLVIYNYVLQRLISYSDRILVN